MGRVEKAFMIVFLAFLAAISATCFFVALRGLLGMDPELWAGVVGWKLYVYKVGYALASAGCLFGTWASARTIGQVVRM